MSNKFIYVVVDDAGLADEIYGVFLDGAAAFSFAAKKNVNTVYKFESNKLGCAYLGEKHATVDGVWDKEWELIDKEKYE